MFYLNFWDINNHFEVLGGAKTLTYALAGGWLALMYFKGGMAGRPVNYYHNIHNGILRFLLGSTVGTGVGYLHFGDR